MAESTCPDSCPLAASHPNLPSPGHCDRSSSSIGVPRGSRQNPSEALFLWEMGQAVHRYLDRVFEAGILCPFRPSAKADTPEPSE